MHKFVLVAGLGLLYGQVAAQDVDMNGKICVEGDDCYVEADPATVAEEFFKSLDADPLMLQVVQENNELQARLEGFNLTKSGDTESFDATLCDDEMDREDRTETCNFFIDSRNELSDEDAKTAQETLIQAGALKRFIELKQLVAWMQPKDKRISRYCFYGCWCLPEGAHSFVAGEGRPVDLVDKACQNMWFCYTCAKSEFRGLFGGKTRECNPDKARYAFKFTYDKNHPAHYDKRDIVCKDSWYNPMDTRYKQLSNCARSVCECDRGLAMRLYRVWRHWDKSRHRIWSQKVVTCPQLTACSGISNPLAHSACIKRGCLFIVKRRCNAGCDEADPDDCPPPQINNEFCCGLFEDDGGRGQVRDHAGTFACCDHDLGTGTGLPWDGNYYNTITHCCPNGVVVSVASGGCP